MKARRTIIAAGVLALGVLGVPGGTATGAPMVLAQQSAATPPRPGKADDPSMVVTYGLILLLAAGIIGANLIPSKRGHQD